MRIITNFKDYYDNCLSYGIDETLVYERLEKRIFSNFRYHREDSYGFLTVGSFSIFFCGKIYHGAYTLSHSFPGQNDFIPKKYHYTLDSFTKHVVSSFDKVNNTYLPMYRLKKSKMEYTIACGESAFKLTPRRLILENPEKYINKFITVVKENNCPVASLTPEDKYSEDNNYIDLNCCLKHFEFNKVIDPFTAFQELSMYIGSVLNQPSKPMIEISNKDMAIKKGFGDKYSFRTPPSKKK